MKQRSASLLIITEDSLDSYSPAGERVRHLALAARTRFQKVAVLTLRQTKKASSERKPSKSPFTFLTANFSRGLPFPFGSFFDPVKMLIFLACGLVIGRRIKPTHILASMPPLETGASAWLIAKTSNARFIIDLRDDWESSVSTQLRRYFSPLLIRTLVSVASKLYTSATIIFAATEFIAATLRNKGADSLLVPNGADTALFKPEPSGIQAQIRAQYSLPRDRVIVIYCGSGINPYYRLDLVVRSIGQLPEPIAGKLFFLFHLYNGQNELIKLKQQLGITSGQLEIRSPLPRKRLARVISACDIGLVPFDAKPYLMCARSTKMYEYLGCGLFVISSGPKGGELDSFFCSQPELGFFTLPSTRNYARVITETVRQEKALLTHGARQMRYEFIRRNYDRQTLMRSAVNALTD